MDSEITADDLGKNVQFTLNVAVALALVAIALYLLNFVVRTGVLGFSVDPASWGQFGDFIGGVLNPCFAFFAFYWAAQAVKLQRTELAATKTELKNAAEAQAKQMQTIADAYSHWRNQDADRKRQALEVGLVTFGDIYNRLLEIELFTDFARWRKLQQKLVPGFCETVEASVQLVLHRDGVGESLRSFNIYAEFMARNLVALPQLMENVDPGKLEAIVRLAGVVGGLPNQIESIRESWQTVNVATRPAALNDVQKRIIRMGSGACAYYLRLLDPLAVLEGSPEERIREYCVIWDALREVRRDG